MNFFLTKYMQFAILREHYYRATWWRVSTGHREHRKKLYRAEKEMQEAAQSL